MGEAQRRKRTGAENSHKNHSWRHGERVSAKAAAKHDTLYSGKRSTFVNPERLAELAIAEANRVSP